MHVAAMAAHMPISAPIWFPAHVPCIDAVCSLLQPITGCVT